MNGLVLGAWAPQIPVLPMRLEITEFTLGLLLLLFGAGAVSAMILAGHLIARHGSKSITTLFAISCCFGLFQIYFTANQSALKGWGITSASMLFDPAVNAYAAYAMYLRAGGWGPWQ